MDKMIDIGRGAGGKARPEVGHVGGGLGFTLGLRHALRGAAPTPWTAPIALDLRRRAGAVSLTSRPVHGLPFAMSLSPKLVAWAAGRLAARQDGAGSGPTLGRPSAAHPPPLVWSEGLSRPSSDVTAPARAPVPATVFASPAVWGRALPVPTSLSASSAPSPSVPLPSRTLGPVAHASPAPAERSPRLDPSVSAFVEPTAGRNAGAPAKDASPEGGASSPIAAGRESLPEPLLLPAARARLAAIAPLWWSAQVSGVSSEGHTRSAASAGAGAAPFARSAPDYTAAAAILSMRAGVVPARPVSPTSSGPSSAGRRSEGLPWPALDDHAVTILAAPVHSVAERGAVDDPSAADATRTHLGDAGLAPSVMVERRAAARGLPMTALPVLAAPLRQWMAGEVAHQVARAADARPQPPPPPSPSIDVSSDAFVRRLLTRIRIVAQEERFRGGLLR